jgi:alpha-N-arabinofuranosidase
LLVICSDIVQMASYAPLFVNDNDQMLVFMVLSFICFLCSCWSNHLTLQLFCLNKTISWNPDAIVFNSWQHYGTPSYWMQTLFRESSGAMLHPITISSSYSGSLAASAITWQDSENSFLRVKASKIYHIHLSQVKFIISILACTWSITNMWSREAFAQVVNFGSDAVSLTISTSGLQASVNALGSTTTVLTSGNVMDENSFSNQNKVIFAPCFRLLLSENDHMSRCMFALYFRLSYGPSESKACL